MRSPLPPALLLVLLAAPALAAPPAASPADPNAPGLSPSARLEALFNRVKAQQRSMRTLEARFLQHRESAMLVAPEEARGVFSYAAPDQVRWEYLSPNPITLLIQGKQMTTWYRDLGRAEEVKVGRYSNQVMKYLGASGSLDTLLEYFTVSVAFPGHADEPYRLELKPKYDRVARRLRGVTVWIDPRLFLPERLRYVDGDGDVTEYSFEDLKVNAELPADRFKLELPAEVKVKVIDLDRSSR